MTRTAHARRWGLVAAAAVGMSVLAPIGPAAADTESVYSRLYSGEGLDDVDDFNDVSTDGGSTWSDATVVASEPGWATIPNTEWISSDAAKGADRENATTLFRRQHRLPPGVTGSTGQLCIHADDAVTVTYNGTTVVEQPAGDAGNASGEPSCGSVEDLAVSGVNTLMFAVPNGTGATGIDFEMIMTYTKDLDAAPLLLLSDITAAATSPAGANVQFTVNAVDATGMTLVGVPCDPPSGSLFAVGETTVTCTATGSNGQSTTGTFRLTVTPFPVANEPPVLSLPGDLTAVAASSAGAAVTYTVTATDDSGEPAVSCAPASGSVFPIGTTTVDCTATDGEGLSDSGSFTVTVTAPAPVATYLSRLGTAIADGRNIRADIRALLANRHAVATDHFGDGRKAKGCRVLREMDAIVLRFRGAGIPVGKAINLRNLIRASKAEAGC